MKVETEKKSPEKTDDEDDTDTDDSLIPITKKHETWTVGNF